MARGCVVSVETSLEARILRSFDRFRDRPEAELASLRIRLIGELLGHPEKLSSTFDPAFEVVMHIGDTVMSLPGSVIVEGICEHVVGGALMWTEFDDLIVDDGTLAASGAMLRLQVSERTLRTTPVALFVRYRGGRMVSEVVFMGGSTDVPVAPTEKTPSRDVLAAQLDS